jgi:hypothetical protein
MTLGERPVGEHSRLVAEGRYPEQVVDTVGQPASEAGEPDAVYLGYALVVWPSPATDPA